MKNHNGIFFTLDLVPAFVYDCVTLETEDAQQCVERCCPAGRCDSERLNKHKVRRKMEPSKIKR